jgi:opine dehydrogenase
MAVLGAGNAGLALAGDLALKGHMVRLYEHPDLAEGFAAIKSRCGIQVDDGSEGPPASVTFTAATHDITEAIEGVRLIHLVVPVSAQETFLRKLIPLLRADQTVTIWAGRFGSLRCAVLRDQAKGAARFGIVEVNSLPHGSRRTGPETVAINFRALVLYAASVEPGPGVAAIEALQAIFPVIKRVESPLEVVLRNSGIPLLGVGALMNIGAIEARGREFSLFRDGMTPAVRKAIRLTHEEMIAVGRALGLSIPPYPEAIYDGPTSIEGANFQDKIGGIDGFMRLTGPDRLNHRYTIENIRYGLAVISALGRRHGVSSPFIDSLCVVCDRLCGPEFAKLGWTLADLGLDGPAFEVSRA